MHISQLIHLFNDLVRRGTNGSDPPKTIAEDQRAKSPTMFDQQLLQHNS